MVSKENHDLFTMETFEFLFYAEFRKKFCNLFNIVYLINKFNQSYFFKD